MWERAVACWETGCEGVAMREDSSRAGVECAGKSSDYGKADGDFLKSSPNSDSRRPDTPNHIKFIEIPHRKPNEILIWNSIYFSISSRHKNSEIWQTYRENFGFFSTNPLALTLWSMISEIISSIVIQIFSIRVVFPKLGTPLHSFKRELNHFAVEFN